MVRDNQVMKTVPLAEGEPTWVFPPESVTLSLMASLSASSDRLLEIASLLPHGRAGWSGSGLEYNVFPSGQCSLSGWAENDQVSFLVELLPPAFHPGEAPQQWQVTAEISVRCDARNDCGMHSIEEFTPNSYATAEDAVAAIEKAAGWLLDRCRAVPPSDWRARDPRAEHP
jgi:hypothetical protein